MTDLPPGKYIKHISHDACGSSDGLAVYQKEDGSHDATCYSCGGWEVDPLGEKDGLPKGKDTAFGMKSILTQEKKLEIITDIYSNYSSAALSDRGLRKETLDYFNVKVALDPADGITPTKHYYPQYKAGNLVGYKTRRVIDKRFSNISLDNASELFGQHQAAYTGSKKVIVTEGEIDCMTVFQVLRDLAKGTDYEHYLPAVVSLVRGADKSEEGTKVVNEVAAQREFLTKFEEIVLVFDQDEQGKRSAQAVARLWPEKVRIADLPLHDPNDMLLAGSLQELKRAVLWKAEAHKPAGLVGVMDVFEEARAKTQQGISWPWPSLTRLSYGIRGGELIGLGAGTGVGKTQAWHTLEQHLINVHDAKIGVFMLEETPSKTLKMLAGKFAGKKFHDPHVEYDQAELDSAIKMLEDKIVLFNHAEDMSWETIKSTMRHMVLVEGCKHIILDPVSSITAHLDSSKANDLLNTMFVDLATMAQALDFTLFYSSHLNAPSTGAVHEEGGRVRAAQFTGSRAMIKFSHLILGLERNTQADDILIRNTAVMRVLKDRNQGNTGTFNIQYNAASGSFLEIAEAESPLEVRF